MSQSICDCNNSARGERCELVRILLQNMEACKSIRRHQAKRCEINSRIGTITPCNNHSQVEPRTFFDTQRLKNDRQSRKSPGGSMQLTQTTDDQSWTASHHNKHRIASPLPDLGQWVPQGYRTAGKRGSTGERPRGLAALGVRYKLPVSGTMGAISLPERSCLGCGGHGAQLTCPQCSRGRAWPGCAARSVQQQMASGKRRASRELEG